MPGIALSESVATSLRLERALRTIPEVAHVVTRTGAPEVATDPMGLEQSDVYVSLKPRGRLAARRHQSRRRAANLRAHRQRRAGGRGRNFAAYPDAGRTSSLPECARMSRR